VFGVFFAKLAIFTQSNTIRIVPFVLIGLIIAIFAYSTT